MKIVSTGSTLSSPGFQEKKKRERRRKRLIWGLGVFFLLALLVFISRQHRFLIQEVRVQGTNTVSPERVEELVRGRIAGYYLWLIPHANALLYSRTDIENSLLKEFTRFRSVAVALEGTKILNVMVVEREPFALYCESAKSPDYASSCFFLDDLGYIFDEAPAFFGPVYFVYASKEPLINPVGREFMKAPEFKPLAQFVSNLREIGVSPVALEVSDTEFNLTLPHDAHIIWQRSSDLNLIYSNLESFLNNDSIKKDQDFLKKIDLLDLRVENKVFYTFK